VRDFQAIAGDNLATLYWTNPLNSDFSHVVILRTEGTCASSCSEPGATVFTPASGATSFTDTTAVNSVAYCYAIFAVDFAGNCSGAGTNSSGTVTPQPRVVPPPVNDPLFSEQWHLHNVGQTGGKVDADMDAPEAWEVEQGSNQVVIAIIDTGVDYNHESKGNGDGIPNTGETIELLVRLRNDGDLPAVAAKARLSTRDPYITITDDSEDFGDIPPGGDALCQFDYDFVISPQCPDDHPVTLNLEISDREGRTWADTISFTVYLPPPEVRYQSHRIAADYRGATPGGGQAGEGDGAVSPGETVELDILLKNTNVAVARGVTAAISTTDPLIGVASGAVEYEDLLDSASGVRGKLRYSFTVDQNHAVGADVSFTLRIVDSRTANTVRAWFLTRELLLGSVAVTLTSTSLRRESIPFLAGSRRGEARIDEQSVAQWMAFGGGHRFEGGIVRSRGG